MISNFPCWVHSFLSLKPPEPRQTLEIERRAKYLFGYLFSPRSERGSTLSITCFPLSLQQLFERENSLFTFLKLAVSICCLKNCKAKLWNSTLPGVE
jgi:hypothetical protein